jgi:hypothetical protein
MHSLTLAFALTFLSPAGVSTPAEKPLAEAPAPAARSHGGMAVARYGGYHGGYRGGYYGGYRHYHWHHRHHHHRHWWWRYHYRYPYYRYWSSAEPTAPGAAETVTV